MSDTLEECEDEIDVYDERKRDKIIMLSLAKNEYEEEKEGKLTGDDKVALLRIYMLNKQMNWMRSVMRDSYEE